MSRLSRLDVGFQDLPIMDGEAPPVVVLVPAAQFRIGEDSCYVAQIASIEI